MARGKKGPPPPGQQDIPIQPVERPILCSPYVEPAQHWEYDTATSAARKGPGPMKAQVFRCGIRRET